ncbi:hypothetical protein N657DRAFT_188230 [Parathielavia appendiculata]|uniref:Uncharacterized protein n=1 Tax=Parathielavia appendiculata TaxID=2587402 RepID=A0AAN6Z620_9PEZI|nr:hypothetical protein N657DRAFT_188230 [Parathielavia appendiculata]
MGGRRGKRKGQWMESIKGFRVEPKSMSHSRVSQTGSMGWFIKLGVASLLADGQDASDLKLLALRRVFSNLTRGTAANAEYTRQIGWSRLDAAEVIVGLLLCWCMTGYRLRPSCQKGERDSRTEEASSWG